jgi:hypothetical protein
MEKESAAINAQITTDIIEENKQLGRIFTSSLKTARSNKK